MGGVNMKMLGKVLAASVCLAGAAAHVDAKQGDPTWQSEQPATEGTLSAGPTSYTKDNYPGDFVARPLILPPWLAQPGLNFGVNNAPGVTGTQLAASFDIGLMEKLQAGATIGFPLNNPDPTFGSFFANAQYGIAEFANVRLDVGAVKVAPGVPAMGAAGGSTGFAFGVGAPIKYRLNDMFAITSGRPYAWAVGDDIITMQFVNSQTFGFVHIPVGVLAQLHPMVAASLRVGGRFGIADAKKANGDTIIQIPVGVDLLVNALKDLDLGLSFDLPGDKDAYADLRQI